MDWEWEYKATQDVFPLKAGCQSKEASRIDFQNCWASASNYPVNCLGVAHLPIGAFGLWKVPGRDAVVLNVGCMFESLKELFFFSFYFL